jgi:hypothetical protein
MPTYEHPKSDYLPMSRARFMRDMLAGKIKAIALSETELPSGRTRIDYDDPGAPVTVFQVAKYNGDWQAALTDAIAARGSLEFAPGTTITSSVPMVITDRVEIYGTGRGARFHYTGSGAAVRVELADGNQGEGVTIRDMQITGTNVEGQGALVAGVTGASPRMLRVSRLNISGFVNGIGVYLHTPVNCSVEECTIQGAREPILMRTACGCAVRSNWLNYWANNAIRFWSVAGDGLAPRNNVVELNIIHGDPAQAQDVAQARAAVRLDGTSSTLVRNNYIEDLAAPPSGAFVCHGVWLQKSAEALTQNNEVSCNYFGPNITGDAIRVDANVTHTAIGRNQVGTYVVRDAGGLTQFDMQHLSDISNLAGSSSNRRGTIGLNGSVVQLHA